jgi:hypothetical protein
MLDISATLAQWRNNFTNNVSEGFTNASIKDWIRIVMVVGTYLLIRPHIIKLAGKTQERRLEAHKVAEEEAVARAVALAEDTESEEDKKDSRWGKKAKLRQRKFLEGKNDEDPEGKSDDEIQQFLED